MVDEKCVSGEDSFSIEIPDIPEVHEFFDLTRELVPDFSVDTVVSYGPCLTNFVAPYYAKAVQTSVLRHVQNSGQDLSCAQGMIAMSDFLESVMGCLIEMADEDDEFRSGFWRSLLSDLVSCTEDLDDFRSSLIEMNECLRNNDRNKEAVFVEN